jgi:hypothetical protein
MKKILLAVLVSVTFFACKSAKEKSKEQIKIAEKTLMSSKTGKLNDELATNLIGAYINYADAYPKDSITPDYLFKAAEVSVAIKQTEQGINLYKRVADKYIKYNRAPEACFVQGFVYDTELHDYFRAAIAYKVFLERYPKHQLAESAQASIDNLDKTDAELMMEFNAKNNTNTAASAEQKK